MALLNILTKAVSLYVFYNKINDSCQKHQDRNLVDRVHGTQVKSTFAVWVFLTEKVSGYFREIK